MFFTQEDYKKIHDWIRSNSIKDTEFNNADTPLKDTDTIALVQNNTNVRVSLKDFTDQLFLMGVSDFLNISHKYGEYYITLQQAIELIPYKSRKCGQVITFLDEHENWRIYQFRGEINQWSILHEWLDILDFEPYIINSILPDEEDLTKTKPDQIGNTYLSLKDREYNPEEFSGMGRIILRKNIVEIEDPVYCKIKKNILYQDIFTQDNTVYEIRYDFNLNGQTITIPENCALDFKGGSLYNGTIIGNKTYLNGKGIIFKEIKINGTFYNLSPLFFNSNDFNIFVYCIENNLDNIIDFKGNTYIADPTNIKTNYITRGNCVIKNFNIEIKENSDKDIFVLLRFFASNITLESFTINCNSKCVRCISFVQSQYVSINNGIIKNVGNDQVEVTIGIEFQGDCSFSNIQNIIIDNVQAKNNSSGVSISHMNGVYFSSYIKVDNCIIKNINSPTDADGIKVLEFIDFDKNILYEAHHSFTNITFENCDKRALKLQCESPFVKNITCRRGYFGQACVDFFGKFIRLDGLIAYELNLPGSYNCIYTHDYVFADIRNVSAENNNVTFDKFNTLIYDQSSMLNSVLNLKNIRTDYNTVIRKAVKTENCTLNIDNLYHIAGYHYIIMGSNYNIVQLENIYIDKNKFNNYWWKLFETHPTTLISKSCVLYDFPISYINSTYTALQYQSASKEYLTTLVKEGKRVTIGDSQSYPTLVYYKYYNVGDEVELPIGKIKCITPPTEEDKVGKWNVTQIYSKNATELAEFIKKPTIYSINFNEFDLYNKSLSKIINTEGWYSIAKLTDGSSGIVTISKFWGNGQPSPCIIAYSYGLFTELKLIHGYSPYTDSIIRVRINRNDSGVYLEVKYVGRANTVNINISNTTNNTVINDIVDSVGEGTIIKEIDLSTNSIIRSTGLFSNKPSNAYTGFAYFCTDKSTLEGSTNGIMIYHKGNNVWVDALGRVIT